ncbi:unnamed protein product [Caenorhabditis auriculariae]|uniref:Uncharacterized protein n=1 Tax=Caenorhabditis auriculariae TaxID=2777116 RepID=A0A8S1HSK9_9PELO|nr:unnamed protein product [Caenorhabditis auriculariae]
MTLSGVLGLAPPAYTKNASTAQNTSADEPPPVYVIDIPPPAYSTPRRTVIYVRRGEDRARTRDAPNRVRSFYVSLFIVMLMILLFLAWWMFDLINSST